MVDGTRELQGTWIQHDNNIYRMSMAAGELKPLQLFVNDEWMIPARWPDARFDDGTIFSFDA